MFLSRKQLTILIVVLLLLITAAVATTIWAVFFRGQGTPPISPDYPPRVRNRIKNRWRVMTAKKWKARRAAVRST